MTVAARKWLAEERLPWPPIPERLESHVRPIGEGLFGTHDRIGDPYDTSWLLEAVGDHDLDDFVLFGRGGYGAASNVFAFVIVCRPLALFVQLPWNNVYGDRTRDAERITDAFQSAAALLGDVDAAVAAGRTQPGEMLVVFQTLTSGALWQRFDDSADSQALLNGEWRKDPDPIAAAREYLVR